MYLPRLRRPGLPLRGPSLQPLRHNPVTAVNDLTLACGSNHKLAEQGWTTRKNSHGHTEWIPPPHLDRGQPRVNTFHHPEKLLCDDGDDEPE